LLTVGNHQFPKPASDEQPMWQSQLARLCTQREIILPGFDRRHNRDEAGENYA
jgi:hypothetical protein